MNNGVLILLLVIIAGAAYNSLGMVDAAGVVAALYLFAPFKFKTR